MLFRVFIYNYTAIVIIIVRNVLLSILYTLNGLIINTNIVC